MEDFELLERWRGGDRVAGGELFDRHFASLARFFRNKVGDRFEDLVQKTFLTIVETQERFRGDSSFRTYLFAVAHNQLRNEVRRLQRERERFDPSSRSVADLGMGAGSMVDLKREQRLVLEALRGVPLDLQIVLELYYWERIPAPEIAEILDIPVGTVRSRIRRGQQRVRAQLEQLTDDQAILVSTVGGLEGWARGLRDPMSSRVDSRD